jgi:hypothetical protein
MCGGSDTMDKHDRSTSRQHSNEPDAGAYIGREPEFAGETIPGGVQPRDERVAGEDSQSSGSGAADERVQGRDDAWPRGHRRGEDVNDADLRRAGDQK